MLLTYTDMLQPASILLITGLTADIQPEH